MLFCVFCVVFKTLEYRLKHTNVSECDVEHVVKYTHLEGQLDPKGPSFSVNMGHIWSTLVFGCERCIHLYKHIRGIWSQVIIQMCVLHVKCMCFVLCGCCVSLRGVLKWV